MLDAVNAVIASVIASPWGYLAIFLVVAADAFFPVMPGEVAVISGAVLAASGEQSLLGVMAVAAVGAFVGDHISYAIGRVAGHRAAERILRGERGRAVLAWAERVIHQRGGMMIVALRFVSGGRTATTLIAGAVCYPLARFAPYAALASSLWALYLGLLGYWTGQAFEGQPLLGLLAGLGIAAGVAAVYEVGRLWRRRTQRTRV